MDQRVRLIADWLSGVFRKTELCEAYGISRPTADKWIRRYAEAGAPGLQARSRAPLRCPQATDPQVAAMIIEMKLQHQTWGPKKVLDRLRHLHPQRRFPADSTGGAILKRAGLVRPRRRRRRVAPYTPPFGVCERSNAVWSADFKGDFPLPNRRRCYPLTVSDNFSRYLLLVRGLERPCGAAVRPWFEWVFREYGLPDAIRTDNGPPFASLALGGLSPLSKWWIRLGIRHERIQPGQPAQNGRHERMHRTLKAQAIAPQPTSLNAQQQRFDAFVHEYNWERSHEALARRTPGCVYQPSPHAYPAKLPRVDYDSHVTVRQVRHNGEIKWRGAHLYVSQVLATEPVGLQPIADGQWELRYSFHRLGILDDRTQQITPARGWQGPHR